MPADISQTARGYLDFSGLGQLRGKAAANDEAALRESAQQFEAMFIQMTLKSMRDTVERNDLTGSDAQDHDAQVGAHRPAHQAPALASRRALVGGLGHALRLCHLLPGSVLPGDGTRTAAGRLGGGGEATNRP